MSTRLPAVLAVSLGALLLADAEPQRLPTRDAFLKVQHSTKSGFLQELRSNPRALYHLAKYFGTGQSALLRYIEDHLSLQRLNSDETFEVACLRPNGSVYTVQRRYRPGEAVWATPDGTPVIRWICTNPMRRDLPSVAVPATTVVPPEIIEQEKAEVREEVKVEVKEEVKTEVREEVKVEVREEVKTEVKEEVKVEVREEVKAEVREEVKIEIKEAATVLQRPWSLWLGAVEYKDENRREKTHALGAYGLSYDFYSRDRLSVDLYVEGAGHLQKGIPLRFFGGGLGLRYALGRLDHDWKPYFGARAGYYDIEYRDGIRGSVDRVGGRLALGVEAPNQTFWEITYHILGERRDLSFNRLGFALGFRF